MTSRERDGMKAPADRATVAALAALSTHATLAIVAIVGYGAVQVLLLPANLAMWLAVWSWCG